MNPITIKNLTFAYPGQATLFDHCQLNLDSSWKLGLLGRNGRGKTTLMNILRGKLAYQGQIQTPLTFSYYPLTVADQTDLTWNNLAAAIPQLAQWQVERELNLMATDPALLWQPFNTLSGGEQTRVMLAALFAQEGSFPLLDEPTNHLDQHGRQLIAYYLKTKKTGFIITSHDQAFLDQIIDHTLVIEQHQLILEQGNYHDYFVQKNIRDTQAISKNEHLQKDIRHLKERQQTKQQWAQKAEHEKANNSHADKGFLGHKAAKMMKKATITKEQLGKTIQQRQGLLQEVEQIVPLTINPQPTHHQTLLTVEKLCLAYPGRQLFNNLSFKVGQHDQVILCGDNGSGKSSLIHAITSDFTGQQSGKITISNNIAISLVRQQYSTNRGTLAKFAKANHINYDDLLNVLRKLGMARTTFNTPIENMSMGQQKKVELARSLVQPANLYIWDEPLNYLDTYNQEQLIQLIKEYQPPMLIIEHDQHFIDTIATKKIIL
ncbi:ribosomal protection-like ABC-F family protein [Limosilactobacillus reuteri]|uniref:ribosomal protection-like ABC-F family protein n=1 Tax=Limosilactobacillus reuteri TaxID=1598 RepID=UPI0021CFACAE|nr:ABC-F type ribosomal protection protein [Limosilactobacillus reuteri]MCU4691315.1 ABC-F type ribosomal protection protein [Limosilactobacillus reuteri]